MGGKDEMTKASSSLQDLRAEPIHQGEGGTNLAFLGTLRPRLQKGDALRSLPDGERKRRGTGNRRGHVRGHRGKRSGEFSGADTGRTGLKYVSAHAGAEEGNSQGRGHESLRSVDSGDPRSCGPGGTQAHPGADLRS